MTHQHQKIFPTKPSPSAQSCTNPPPQPILPSIPKQTATTSKSRTTLFSAPKKLKKPSKPSKPQSAAKGRSKEEKVNICLREMFRFGEMGLDALKRGMDLVGESERLEFDRRWKMLRVQESRVFLQRAELVEKQLELIYKALQGSS